MPEHLEVVRSNNILGWPYIGSVAANEIEVILTIFHPNRGHQTLSCVKTTFMYVLGVKKGQITKYPKYKVR